MIPQCAQYYIVPISQINDLGIAQFVYRGYVRRVAMCSLIEWASFGTIAW